MVLFEVCCLVLTGDTRSEIRGLGTCADPELIDAGAVVAPLVSGTDSYAYGSLSEAKRSSAAVSADFPAEHVPAPAQHTARGEICI